MIGDGVLGLNRLYGAYLKKNGCTIKRANIAGVDLKKLVSILNNNDFSPPIVSVDEKYYMEQNKGYRVSEVQTLDVQHQLVINDINTSTDEIEIFDPDAPRIRKHNKNVGSNGLIKIAIHNFLKYWEGTQRDTIWIAKGNETPLLDSGQKMLG